MFSLLSPVLSGIEVLINTFFPIRTQRYAASDSGNRFAQNFIVELRSLAVRVVIDRSICSNSKMLCRLNCINVCTEERIELDEGALTALNMRYQLLMDALDEEPEVEITYFKPDERKAGGAYVTATGAVIKVDDFERLITMQDGTKIPMDDILSIDGELFLSLE